MEKIRFALFLILVFTFNNCGQKSQQNAGYLKSTQTTSLSQPDLKDSVTFISRTEGPFLIGNSKRIRVFISITRVHFPKSIAPNWPESDVSYTIVDSTGAILLRRNFPANGEWDMSFDFTQEDIPSIGSVVNCGREVVPSAPGSGADYQLFGLNSIGQIVSLTGVISSETFKIVFLNPSQGTTPISPNDALSRPFIESEIWTGNFTALVYHSIYPDGVTFDDAGQSTFGFEKIPVRINDDETRQNRERNKDKAPIISLFDSPDRNSTNFKNISVDAGSSIQFLNAVRRDGWWLHVVIDTREGYVRSEDFDAIGLPDAG